MNVDGSCATCVRLRLQCLGFGAKRPEWLRENRNVLDLRDKIKTFLASQGMIKGHSGSATRAAEQEQQILSLSTDYVSPTNSPQTPTLSISSTNDERPSTYPLRTNTGRYPDSDHLPVMQELSPDSPLERSEYLLPPVPYSSPPVINSLDSWQSNHSLLPQRPHSSHFSRLHNVPIQYEEDIVDVVSSGYLLPSIPAVDQYTWPLLDEHQNASLDYYMKHVLRAQYLHASDSLDSIIWKLIHTSDNARQAACLLSDLHRKSTQKNRLGIMDVEDVEALSRMQMGQWQTFLDTACNYSLSVLNHWGGARKVLLVCSESLRFIIKTSIWFDVLASATLVREPRFLGVIQELYGRQSAFFDDVPAVPMAEYSMMSVMGCENHIVLALAEIASLANWKEAHVSAGSLSVKELVRRGHKIEEILIKPSSYPSESDVTLDPAESQRAQQRRLTSEVFRASAYVYLHSVVSGDFPRCPEIIEAVNDTVNCLMAAEDGPTGRAVVRSVEPRHQNYFLKRLQEQQSLSIGNSQQVSCLIQEVWKRRSQRR
ncbi:fungal-specific transcription factor domain-containing protein, partial [Boletus edulis]